jgi:serine protease AprX
MIATTFAAVLSLSTFIALQSGGASAVGTSGPSASAPSSSSPLAALAADHPDRRVEVIVQLRSGVDPNTGHAAIANAGGAVTKELPLINGLATTLPAEEAQRLSLSPAVHAVSLNAPVETQAVDTSRIATAYNQSIRSDKVWNGQNGTTAATGKGVGVAVLDTGIDGTLPDFRVSETDPTSRVVASAIVNPGATRAGDSFGHGTHIAGLIAGNGNNRPASDPVDGKYVGVAPDANLIDVKIADEQGNATVMDVIDGLQFVVDHKQTYNIRIANLSLRSTVAESYKTDPLDAAVEAAWNSGIVVIVAAGNDGPTQGSVNYAPANDPYVITVGGVDDMGTKKIEDDALETWSSRGTTQDGFEKPEVVAPGARMVSTMSPNAEYTRLCPTCLTDGGYFRVGGTSMAAAVASGQAALLLEAAPALTPNQVKAQLVKRTRAVESAKTGDQVLVDANGNPVAFDHDQYEDIEEAEIAADKAIRNDVNKEFNTGLGMNVLLDPSTGLIDYTRASWSRASWSTAAEGLRASWSRASWSRASWSRASWSATPESCTEFERASWSRASWSRASWSRASWSRASWSADGMSAPDLTGEDLAAIDAEIAAAQQECSQLLAQVDPSRASWSRASWSRASWSSSFTK